MSKFSSLHYKKKLRSQSIFLQLLGNQFNINVFR